jgi:hypothetical protein
MQAKIGDREEEFIQAKHIMEDDVHAACVNKYLPMSTPRIRNVMLFILFVVTFAGKISARERP